MAIASWPLQLYADSLSPTGSDKAATTALRRLGLLFEGSQTLAFNFRFQSNTPDGKIDIIRGFADKPNKFRIDELVNGKVGASVISDGKVVYAYQASTGRCQTMTALKTYTDAKDRVVRKQTTDLLGSLFLPILMFFSGNPDLAGSMEAKGAVFYSSSPFLLDGATVTRVIERVRVRPTILFNQSGYQYDLDTRTGLLHEIQLGSISVKLNRFSYFFRFSFSVLRLGTFPLPASIFTWTPPNGLTLGLPIQTEPTAAP